MCGRGREDEGELSSHISDHLRPWNLPQHQLTHLAHINKGRIQRHCSCVHTSSSVEVGVLDFPKC